MIFALMTMLSAASAVHVCNSGWNAYVPSAKPREFAVMGCDMVYNELIKQAFPKDKCTLVSVASKDAVCLTTKATDRGTCRSDGKYGFDAQVIVKCLTGTHRWVTATVGNMKEGKIALTNFYYQKIV
jgi:hypothetical protein